MPPSYREWIEDAEKQIPPIVKRLASVNYLTLAKHTIAHPVLVARFLLARLGLTINS